MIDRLADAGLDFVYIDGDHTLRGITGDLIRLFPIHPIAGFISGDDFVSSIWQHGTAYEPTLVFPLAVHFAQAVGAPIYGLPFSQFRIAKRPSSSLCWTDLTGKYPDPGLRPAVEVATHAAGTSQGNGGTSQSLLAQKVFASRARGGAFRSERLELAKTINHGTARARRDRVAHAQLRIPGDTQVR